MPDENTEYAILAQLVASRDAAVDAAKSAGPVASAALDKPAEVAHEKRPPKTTSGVLLQRAVAILGREAVAQALDLPVAALDPFLGGRKMTLAQQRLLGLAVLAVSDGHGELRRRALTLLGQVRAVSDFQSDATETHMIAPPTHHWW